MLVLSRKLSEAICVGDSIKVTVLQIRGDRVRLGIEAPSEVSVHREEVYETLRAEREAANRLAPVTPDVTAAAPPKDGERLA